MLALVFILAPVASVLGYSALLVKFNSLVADMFAGSFAEEIL